MTKRALLATIFAAQFLAVVALPGMAIHQTAPASVSATHQAGTSLADDPLPCPDCNTTP